jgi:hypothetical protein
MPVFSNKFLKRQFSTQQTLSARVDRRFAMRVQQRGALRAIERQIIQPVGEQNSV